MSDGVAQWCFKDKPDEAVNVREKRCKEDGCDKQLMKGYEYCATCDPDFRFRRGAKHMKVHQYFIENLSPEVAEQMKEERRIQNECGFKGYRTDIKIPLIDRTIAIEVTLIFNCLAIKYFLQG